MKKKRFIFMLLSFLMAINCFSQAKEYQGAVVDSHGEPIIGASVLEKGTSNGTVTDVDGLFKIKLAKGDGTITVSYIGFETQDVKAYNDMRIVLRETATVLNDLVVIGYGTQKKSVVTASIAKVGADDLAATAPVRMDNALKGLAAGVTVTSASGQPGAAAQIRVRGIGTINNSDPLYIVDGMPIEGGLDYVNPTDIESIEVLKDAASGAIYVRVQPMV